MSDKREKKKLRDEPKVAPGIGDAEFGEDANREEIRKGNSTKVVRLFLDENDPS